MNKTSFEFPNNIQTNKNNEKIKLPRIKIKNLNSDIITFNKNSISPLKSNKIENIVCSKIDKFLKEFDTEKYESVMKL